MAKYVRYTMVAKLKLLPTRTNRQLILCSSMDDELHHQDGVKVALERRSELKTMLRQMHPGQRDKYGELIWACTDYRALEEGICVHKHIVAHGLGGDVFLSNCLITMYGKCRSVDQARLVFDGMSIRNVFSWTAMITAYAQNGHHDAAVRLFDEMDLEPNFVTLLTCVSACCQPWMLQHGRRLHKLIVDRGFDKQVNVCNALLTMYSKCGSLHDAEKYFSMMRIRNVISWNGMVTAYIQHGRCDRAVQLFRLLLNQGLYVSSVTFLTILNACHSPLMLEVGKWIHACIAETGYLLKDMALGSALVSMYAKCYSLECAKHTFDDLSGKTIITWTAMITACAQHGQAGQALDLFRRMQLDGVRPNEVTLASVVNACVTLLALREGIQVHKLFVSTLASACTVALDNALIDMYGKCGDLAMAWKIFHSIGQHRQDEFSWTSMLTVCAYRGQHRIAIHLFKAMQLEGFKMDRTCYAGVVVACTGLGDITEGRRIYSQIVEAGYSSSVLVSNAIMDMFSKCGCPDEALDIFNTMVDHDAVTWNALISSFSEHGHGDKVPKLFHMMQREGWKPDKVTFVSLLSACSHAGLVNQGCRYFGDIFTEYMSLPSSENYGCLVDLLARAGHLSEAENLLARFPPSAERFVPCTALLSACKVYGDTERAQRASKLLAGMDAAKTSSHVILANAYVGSFK